jgi:hypothetical protein
VYFIGTVVNPYPMPLAKARIIAICRSSDIQLRIIKSELVGVTDPLGPEWTEVQPDPEGEKTKPPSVLFVNKTRAAQKRPFQGSYR